MATPRSLPRLTLTMLAVALVTLGSLAFAEDAPPPAPAPANDASPAVSSKMPATSISTFHCLSLYWSPENGALTKKVLVKFREVGETSWHDGLSMRYNPVKTPECKGDYRGSIVNLKPGTTYEITLALEGTGFRTALKAATWKETFPVVSTTKCESGAETLAIKDSGTPEGYIVYDGKGCTIDCKNKADYGILVDASYVILRGFTIKNVNAHCIRINSGHHIVIEDCDLSHWGSEEERGFGFDSQAGVYSNRKDLHALVVQRCKFHNPSWDSNSWAENHFKSHKSTHPDGPQTIVLYESEGNNVIRYNECWSDPDHYYNDVLGGANNGSYRGYPGADSDIYCNYVANCWDDGIEAEGGGQNVRIWNNYIENTMMTIANAATSIGPLYIWRNVGGRSYSPPGSEWGITHGNFMKMGYADSENWMTGHIYVFNNTIFQPKDEGAAGLGGDSRIIKHCVTRNNIFQARSTDTHSISTDKSSIDNDYDYDLLSGRYPDGQELHGIKDKPIYVADAGFSFEKMTGNFQQAADSPGVDKGVIIPNFCDVYQGAGPDLGAHEAGTGTILYGVKAEFVPPGTAGKLLAGGSSASAGGVPAVPAAPAAPAAPVFNVEKCAALRKEAIGRLVALLKAHEPLTLALMIEKDAQQVTLLPSDPATGLDVKLLYGGKKTLTWDSLDTGTLGELIYTLTGNGDPASKTLGGDLQTAALCAYVAGRSMEVSEVLEKLGKVDPDLQDQYTARAKALK